MTVTEAELSERTFGCELEYEHISMVTAAQAVARAVGGAEVGSTVRMPDGRVWKVVRDGSVPFGCEVVSPILRWDDIETLKAVVRALRAAGAKADQTTGLHVHVGIGDFTAEQIRNLVRTFYKQERLILAAAGTLPNRIARYTKNTDRTFVAKICEMHRPTKDKLNEAWFGRLTQNFGHYDAHRYRALNLNNLWGYSPKGTVEFRFWNGTTAEDEVMASVQMSLLLAIRGKVAKASSAKRQRRVSETSAKYDLRVFLLRLGAIGPTFKTMRRFLMRNLPGSAAWKDGRHD